MAKHKPLHPLQELVTKGEVIAALQQMIPDLIRSLDKRYVRQPPPDTVARETSE